MDMGKHRQPENSLLSVPRGEGRGKEKTTKMVVGNSNHNLEKLKK